jgi:hypothetical protein
MTQRQIQAVSWAVAALGLALLFTGHKGLACGVLVLFVMWCWYWIVRAGRHMLDEPTPHEIRKLR